jgi:hypothetical protein
MAEKEVRLLEIRDRGTFIPAMAVRLERNQRLPLGHEDYLLWRAGYESQPAVYLGRLSDGTGSFDPYDWGRDTRTMPVAHEWISRHWDELPEPGVIDVEFILGETPAPKKSEQIGEDP